MLKQFKFTIFQAIVIFIPASLILYYVLNAGILPDNDYWGFIAHFLSEQGGFSTKIVDWIKRDNEHFILFPKIVYAVNIAVTGGNNVALSFFSWLTALLQVLLLYHLIPVKSNQHPVFFTGLLFAIAVFTFSPTQAHNWIFGMSGVAWISANLFSLSAIFAVNRYAKTTQKIDLILLFFFSLLAISTYSTSLALFPTLIIAVFILKLKRPDQIIIGLFSALVIALFLSAYSTPSHHPTLRQPIATVVSYFFTYIGSLFTTKQHVATFIGFLGLFSSVFMLITIYKKKPYWQRVLPWGFIQLYVCGNAAMASLARSGFNVEQALASRYGSLPSLFWLSWIMIAFSLCIQESKYRKHAFIAFFVVSSTLVFNTYRVGLKVAKPLLERAAKKHRTLAAIYSYAFDEELIHNTFITGVPIGVMNRLTRILEANQHIPFNGIFKQCPKINSRITRIHEPMEKQYFGHVEELTLGKNLVTKVRGWAYNRNQIPACIVLTNYDNIVKGVASNGLSRPDIPKANANIISSLTGWEGYGNFGFSDRAVKVYMLSSFDDYWIPLSGYYQIHRQPPYVEKIELIPEN